MSDKRLKILIADDEEGLRLSMACILELEGHEVITAADGTEAIELAKKNAFDIAFLDIKMPGLNGVETFKEIKKLRPETIVIMMTAYAVNDLIKEAIREGAYACISKPFDMEKIFGTIKEVADKPFVLVIDQDPSLCDQIQNHFKSNGYNVVVRASGTEGLELAQRRIPDVILLDVVMEQMDGIETFKKMKELLGDRCPKTVVISSQDLPDEFNRATQLGALACLHKPLDIARLQQIITGSKDTTKERICIVDDDKLLCSMLKKTLSLNGYEVDVANSGTEIIDKLQRETFKVIILDVRLPDSNGIEVYEKIKQANNALGVIFISGGQVDDEHISNALQKNNYTYLHKPFEPQELIKLIEAVSKNR